MRRYRCYICDAEDVAGRGEESETEGRGDEPVMIKRRSEMRVVDRDWLPLVVLGKRNVDSAKLEFRGRDGKALTSAMIA